MQPAFSVATTTAGQETESAQPALMVATTAGQELESTQHDGNQLAGSSSAMQELSDSRRRGCGISEQQQATTSSEEQVAPEKWQELPLGNK